MTNEEGLRLIREFGDALSLRALAVLRKMMEADARDPGGGDGELVREGRTAYLDLERVSSKIVDDLLRACALRADHLGDDGMERYRINETGRAILARRQETRR